MFPNQKSTLTLTTFILRSLIQCISQNEKGKPASILWPQIIDWKIETEKDNNTHYLFVKTADKTRRINISWLDKSAAEIEELLTTFTKK